MNSQEYIEVAISIAPYSEENAEIVTAEVSELPFESFSSEDPFLKCYIQKDLYDAQALKVVLSALEGMDFTVDFNATLVPPVNWNAVWESQFTPIVVDDRCTIKASFHKDLKRTRYNITIDPKMAFGTGHHQTTYMMCRALLQNEDAVRGKVVMDMGCGTAVLAILAAKMKASRVYGIDIDAIAAISAYDNARLNRVGKLMETYCGDASLLFVSVIKFLKGLHFGDIACFNAYLLSVIHTVRKYKFKRTAHIKERSIVPAIGYTRFLRLNTADYVIVTSVL